MAASFGRRGGFSLVDALVTLVVIGLVALSALSALGAGLDGAHRAGWKEQATALAERRLVDLELLSRAELAAASGHVEVGRFPEPYGAYTWSVAVQAVPDEMDLWEATVTVERGRTAVTLRTRLYRPPLEVSS
ncbi:MAG: hypothetical protein IRZ00_11325 [Gemmatimonadetes bacterium]|nr:hypothetical protein [Gemmatimonadota bacterium]